MAQSTVISAMARGLRWQKSLHMLTVMQAQRLCNLIALSAAASVGSAMADGTMSAKFMKSAFVGWTFTAGVYYPPDFDASKLMPVKALKPKGPQMMNIRMMFPFTMVCDSCKEYNYTGTKFTAKTEQIKGESYLGLKAELKELKGFKEEKDQRELLEEWSL
eukprot:g9114.t1